MLVGAGLIPTNKGSSVQLSSEYWVFDDSASFRRFRSHPAKRGIITARVLEWRVLVEGDALKVVGFVLTLGDLGFLGLRIS